MICSRGRYLEGKGDAPDHEIHNGVSIRRVRATSFGKANHLGRLVDYFSFHALAATRLACSRWPDVVVTLTTPPLIGVCGHVARVLCGAKHVNFLMDLHPDAEFECGMIDRASLPGRLLERVAGSILRQADMNVVLGSYQGQRVAARGVDSQRIAEIPVWSDGQEISPVPHAENELRVNQGWEQRFVVMYSGNAGIVHGFDEVLAAAKILNQSEPAVLFVFVGGGPRTTEIQSAAKAADLENVHFLPYFDRSELRYSLSAADVHFMSLLPRHVGVAVPGKLYGILAAGRPVLFAGSPRCETAETIIAAGAGAVFQPGQGRELAEEIVALKAEPSRCAQLGARGREYFLKRHEREVCVAAWRELLESLDGVSTACLSRVEADTLGTATSFPKLVEDATSLLPAESKSEPAHKLHSRAG